MRLSKLFSLGIPLLAGNVEDHGLFGKIEEGNTATPEPRTSILISIGLAARNRN